MDFYLTGPDGRRLHFPVNPERVEADTGVTMRSFDVLDLGRVEYPSGRTPAKVSWEGLFPGAGRQGLPFVKAWRAPVELLEMLQTWRDAGARCRLLITETPLNLDAYVERIHHTWSGGMGDMHYRLELTQHRNLMVLTDTEWQARSGGAQSSAVAQTRPTVGAPATYTVAAGDTLWTIAKQVLGDGSLWRRLYETNRDLIGADPDVIVIGQVLGIPATGGGTA